MKSIIVREYDEDNYLLELPEEFLTALGVKVGDFIDIEPSGNGFFVKKSENGNE
jgi:uncharacterized membrane protein (UPF0127 family)